MKSLIAMVLLATVAAAPLGAQMRRPAYVRPDGSVVQSGFTPGYAAQARAAPARDAARTTATGGSSLSGGTAGTLAAPPLPNPYRVQAQTYAAPSAATAVAPTDAAVPVDQGAINATTATPKGRDASWQSLRTPTPPATDAPAASPPPQ